MSFELWVAEVVETVQREGSYRLEEAEVQPAEPGAPVAYAMPEQVAEAIVRLEAHNLQLDEELANGQRESIALQQEMLTVQRETLATQKATLAVQQALVRALERIADRFDALVLARPVPGGRGHRPDPRREG